jgi:hypothetical protein
VFALQSISGEGATDLAPCDREHGLTWLCPAARHDAQKQRAEAELAKAQAEADRVKREKLERKEERRRQWLESQKMQAAGAE